MSIAPYHVVPTFREQFSVFFDLVTIASTGAFTVLGDRLSPRGLFGHCLLITREAYQRVGGYAAVKGHIWKIFVWEKFCGREVCRCGPGRDKAP